MSKIIDNGDSQIITVETGHYVKIAWLGGTYTLTAVAGGLPNLPAVQGTANSAADQTFGPYASAVTMRLQVSAIGAAAWDSGASPVFEPPGDTFVRQSDGIPVALSGTGTGAAFIPLVDGGGNSSNPTIVVNIVNRGEAPLASVATTAPNTRFVSRRGYEVLLPGKNPRFRFDNRGVAATEFDGPAGIVLVGVYAELVRAGVSTSYAATFSGAATRTMGAGELAIYTDPFPFVPQPGDKVYFRGVGDTDATLSFLSDQQTGDEDQCFVYAVANENNQVSGTGALVMPSGGSNKFLFTPTCIVAETDADAISVISAADSIDQGLNDFPVGTGSPGRGLGRRFSTQARLPHISYAVSGKTMSSMATGSPLLLSLQGICTHFAVFSAGTNDINTAVSYATMTANFATIQAAAKGALVGAKDITWGTVLPRGATTDGCTSLVNQTPGAQYGVGGLRDQWNFFIRSTVRTGKINRVIDFSKVVEDPTDSTRWAVLPFSSTLAAAYASGAVISVNALPRFGEQLVLDTGGTPTTSVLLAKSFTNTAAPFALTLSSSPGVAKASGVTFKATQSVDMVHPSAAVYETVLVPKAIAEFPSR